jgi:tyrosine aminotransferase
MIDYDDGIVTMSSLVGKHLQKIKSDEGTDSSTTPATSTSSSPYLHPLASPPSNVPSGFTLQLNDAIISTAPHLEQHEDSSDKIAALSSRVVIAAPASQKSQRTHNPIRAIVDPIMALSVKCGKERGDGKDQISLAVSSQL